MFFFLFCKFIANQATRPFYTMMKPKNDKFKMYILHILSVVNKKCIFFYFSEKNAYYTIVFNVLLSYKNLIRLNFLSSWNSVAHISVCHIANRFPPTSLAFFVSKLYFDRCYFLSLIVQLHKSKGIKSKSVIFKNVDKIWYVHNTV